MAVIRQTTIPKAPLARLMLRAGAGRVAQDALDAMEQLLSEKAHKLGTHAAAIAKHAGRKTVTGADLHVAAKQ
jgi:histone H3/H4